MTISWINYMDIPNGIGGAEGMDRDMISKAPEPVELFQEVPDDLSGRVVVTGTAYMTNRDRLEGVDYLYWPHDAQENDPRIYAWARKVVWTTPAHQEWGKQFGVKAEALNPSWFDTSLFHAHVKTKDALWAHRDVWHKGLQKAKDWAAAQGTELTVITGRPRFEVAEAMAIHRRFVLFSDKIFDIAPRSVMEAQLSGCELVLNELVGFWDEPPDDLRARIDRAADEFWSL